ncbi:hypothetical protein HMPREF0971_01055 [Segatella oris F0302]|uniref:Uncharacterized protein n=1 Tax=Segatella oris F0302 TaxID=649760 RepID=D1QQ08_9BACT|nr:hypothetical protein HMPREF0971_01055 [Segatella oris F0302]
MILQAFYSFSWHRIIHITKKGKVHEDFPRHKDNQFQMRMQI